MEQSLMTVFFQSLGSIVFEDDMSGTYIVKVEQDLTFFPK